MHAASDSRISPLSPYVVATSALAAHLDRAPLGELLSAEQCWDPLRQASAPFLRRVEQLDAAAFAERGTAMPRWALYDCAELPGVITGLAQRTAEGLCPLSMLIAVPRLGERRWLIYRIASPHAALHVATLDLALALLRAREIEATLSWSAPELAAYAGFAPLALRAARLPAHDIPATCVICFEVDADRLDQAIAGVPREVARDALLDVNDPAVIARLQGALEASRAVQIVGAPRREGEALLVPFSIGAAR